MGDSIGFFLLIQIILIALNAVFTSAEIAVLSINDVKLERMAQEGNSRARRLFRLTRDPARFLATIQVAITLSGFLGSAFAADHFSEPLVDWLLRCGLGIPRVTLDTLALILITLILSYITLIFGELMPKRLAMKKPEQIALGISGLVGGIAVIFRPVVWLLSVSTNGVLRLCGIDPNEAGEQVSEEDIRTLVDAGSERGAIDHHEKEFIQNIFEFNDISAGEIVTHRTDVTILCLEDPDSVWAETIHKSRHTRYPVCDGSPDNVVGILNAKDYFRLSERSRERVLASSVRPAYFVPETVKADVLFRNMKKAQQSLAVVIDEYGGMVGILTMLDLVEELVGELNAEEVAQDEQEPHLERINDHSWQIFGNLPLRELEEATGLELAAADYDTFTGLIFDRLGQVPGDGAQAIDLCFSGLRIHISSVEAHQVKSATVTLIGQNAEPKTAVE